MASRDERLKELLSRVFEEQGAITSVEAEEGIEHPVNPTYKDVKDFLGDKGRSQVFKEVKQEWPSRIRKPLRPGIHFAIDGLDWKTQAPQSEQPGFKEQQGYKFILCMIDRATRKLLGASFENANCN